MAGITSADTSRSDGRRGGDRGTEAPLRSVRGGQPAGLTTGRRALVVDDDADARAYFMQALLRDGMDVVAVSGGREALAVACATAFDVIVLDLRLPDISGTQVLMQLRLSGLVTPVVTITGWPSADSEAAVRASWGTTYLVKPIRTEILCERVRDAIAAQAAPATDPRDAHDDHVSAALAALRALTSRPPSDPTAPEGQAARRLATRAMIMLAAKREIPVKVYLAACRGTRLLREAGGTQYGHVARRAEEGLLAAVRKDVTDPRVKDLVWALSADRRSNLTLTSVAAGWRTTPVEAAAAIGRSLGVSLRELRWKLRTRPALASIVDSTEHVGQVAYRCGYDHPSQLDHDVRRLLGCSPSAIRHLLRRQEVVNDSINR